MANYYRGGAPAPTYSEKCLAKAGDALDVASRARCEGLAKSGPLSRREMEYKRDGALDVASRAFWEGLISKLG